MIRLLIADDDTIVRTAIKTMTDWAQAGIAIVAEATNGKQALDFLKSMAVDVVLTDIKMPLMDGLALLEAMARLSPAPAAIVLSAYDEFALVRRAFTLGAIDYLLKSEMSPATIANCVKRAAERSKHALPEQTDTRSLSSAMRLREAALSHQGLRQAVKMPCVLACFELDDYPAVKRRFGAELERDLVRPLVDFAGQIPGAASRSTFCSLSPSRYLLAFELQHEPVEHAYALCRQIARAWKIYMNLSASIGLSAPVDSPEDLDAAFTQCLHNTSLKIVFGPGQLLDASLYADFDLPWALRQADALAPLLEAMRSGNDLVMNEERVKLFARLINRPDMRAHQVLAIVYHVALSLESMGTSLSFAFDGEEFDYMQRIKRFQSVKECEIWTTNFLRHVAAFLAKQFGASQSNIMAQARRYLLDQYHNPSLSVRDIADAVGLSEKYFSTRFNKAFGQSVSAYINALRIGKARELLQQTDLKVYEVAEAVGFSNTEHFIRVFSKQVGMSPSLYKKSISNELSTNRT